MSRLFGPVFQIAWIVRDSGPAIRHFTERLGIGPFFTFPVPLDCTRLEVDGIVTAERDYWAEVLVAYSGETMVEIIVPGAAPSFYQRHLADGGSGVQHLGTIATDYDAQLAAARAAGGTVVMQGELPLSRFAYLESGGADAVPGTMIELIEPKQPMLDLFEQLKAAAATWDGSDPVRAM